MVRALGRYELLRPLARGGMAEVFLARRRTAGVEKILVIKRIRPERAGDARFLALFVREARLSMTLAHQNIVPVFDFGRAADQVFLAMERVEGKDLGSSLARAARLPPPVVAAFLAAECCQALAYAHDRRGPDGAPLGIVHRDVTPRNVLVSWSGEVKLTDFGIAGLAGDEAGRLVGTPAYMAPEQARGEATDARADVYALGLVLREALTGVRARPGTERLALVDAARSGALAPWPDVTDPQVAALRPLVDRATAARPADRFATAAAFGEALDEFLVGARAATRGDAPARQLAAWMDETWRGARDEPLDDAVPGGDELQSMAEAAMGTGTERSLAATAADEGEAGAAGDEDIGGSAPVDAHADTATAPPIAPPPRAITQPTAPVARRRWPWLAAAIVAGGAIATAVVRPWSDRGATRAGDGSIDASHIAVVALDAPIADVAIDGATIDDATIAAPISDAAVASDADSIDAAPIDTTPIDAGIPTDARRASRPDAATPASLPIDAGPRPTPDAAAATAPAERRVRINARPWATFTVDDGATEYETISTVELTPGPHRIRFRNPALGIERTVTIVVPPDRDLDHVEDLRR